MANLKINSKSPTAGPDPSGAYYYNFSNPAYTNDAWPFNITNNNIGPSGFNVTSLNFTATTYFRQYVRDIDVDVAADGVRDLGHPGLLQSQDAISDIGSVFQDALNKAAATADMYGNQMCTIPMNISAKGYGNVTISALHIEYTYTAQLPDFAASLLAYLTGRPNGTVPVPVDARAASAGTLRLAGLNILVDAPPSLTRNIPDLGIKQETSNFSLVNLSEYFSDDRVDAVDQAPLAFRILGNSNSSNVELTLNGSVLGARALTVNWSGRADVTVQASDGRGLTAQSNQFAIIVTRVNKAPVITSAPPDRAEAGKNFIYNVTADDDYSTILTYRLTEYPPDMTVTPHGTNGTISWKPVWDQRGLVFNVTVSVSDGEFSVFQKFNLTVFSNNSPPGISPVVKATAYAGRPYLCQIVATDNESEPMTYSLDPPKPSAMTINATTGLISWASPAEGNYSVFVNVTDGIGYNTYYFMLRVVKNTPPRITSSPPANAMVGEEYRYELAVNHTDENQTLVYKLVKFPDGMTVTARGVITWTPKDSQKGKNHVVINITDGLDNATQSFDIDVAGAPILSVPGGNDLLVWLLLIIIIVVCAAVAGMYYRKRKKDSILGQRWPEMPKRTEGPAITPLPPDTFAGIKSRQTGAAPVIKEAVPIHEKPEPGASSTARVQDIFVIYRDGRLIHHLTNRLTPLDHEIFASMFSSVQDFMKDSMGADRIDSIKYEDYNIILENGKNLSLAVVLSGDEVPDIRQVIKTSIADVELVCARLLEKWDGDAAPLRKDLELLLKPISEAVGTAVVVKKVKHKNAEEYVSILSGIEFFRGYVKVKMEVHNDLDNVITDAMVKIIVKQDALRIGWVEPPAYTLSGDSIVIGNVQPGETIALNLFLDPLVCTGSFVDATLAFKDAKGDLYSIVMNRRKAEVVCPTFHTDEEINVAVLRKMITEFQQHDTKIYTLPEGLWSEEAFKMGMSVIEAHNVRLVREFTETTPSYAAEAWYFGKTQIKKEQVVMRISVSREHNSLEFFVGSSDLPAITGLLAEFGHELNRRLKNKGLIQQNIKHLDLTDKDRVNRKSQLLLHRYAEAEAGAAENEPKK
jgi:hypothetical protein